MGKNYCVMASKLSTDYEICSSDIKRRYYIKNITQILTIMSNIDGFKGAFGTGYPFYLLDDNLEGELPIINEQIRYNMELLKELKSNNIKTWICANCLRKNINSMPDLKQVCNGCLKISNSLKPRKVINRLPDIDFWMICEDGKINNAKARLQNELKKYNMHTSDVDPLGTIDEFSLIVDSLTVDEMPDVNLPLDIHIIEYSKMKQLLSDINLTIDEAVLSNAVPFLPIHPISLRKRWQYDDTPYNFIQDYFLSLTPFKWNKELQLLLIKSRILLVNKYDFQVIYNLLIKTLGDSSKRRMNTEEMRVNCQRRLSRWVEMEKKKKCKTRKRKKEE